MNAEQATTGDGSAVAVARNKSGKRMYGVEERERLIREQAESGLSKVEFCAQHGIHTTTFYGWAKRMKGAMPQLAEVETSSGVAPIEIALPNGKRLGIYINGGNGALVDLIRGVLGC